MDKIAKIIPLTKTSLTGEQSFYYKIPSLLKNKIFSGQEVLINFKNKNIRGIVAETVNNYPRYLKLKELAKLIDDQPIITPAGLRLAYWMHQYYLAPLGQILKMFAPPRPKKPQQKLEPLSSRPTKFHILKPEQKSALDAINKVSSRQPFLLHGVTGSGKTEIYLQLIKEMVKQKKQTILLVPEIALTPQIIKIFSDKFPGQVATRHSKQSLTQIYDIFNQIRSNKIKVVIGPRSSLFTPTFNLGLIIVDEEHDSSYKQTDQAPRYHARDVAVELAKITTAKIVLGSATPSLESYYRAKNKDYLLLELKRRINQPTMPQTKIIDMRDEFKKRNFSIFSEQLQTELDYILKNKKQAILFINRRGASTSVICRDCGFVVKCPHCNSPLAYHLAINKLICHHCDFTTLPPNLCPACNSQYIKYLGAGTQKVEAELLKLFPAAKTLRLDRDSTTKINQHQEIFNRFARHEADILIGTQMVAKGFDLHLVDLVGIISADTNLYIPDYRSHERSFQLLNQVAGRTGRKYSPGKVIIQTYNPENKIIRLAAANDYQKYYSLETKERMTYGYPPFYKLIKLTVENSEPNQGKNLASQFYKKINQLCQNNKNIIVFPPIPAFYYKIRNNYRFNIIIKHTPSTTESLKKLLKKIMPDKLKIDIDPENIL